MNIVVDLEMFFCLVPISRSLWSWQVRCEDLPLCNETSHFITVHCDYSSPIDLNVETRPVECIHVHWAVKFRYRYRCRYSSKYQVTRNLLFPKYNAVVQFSRLGLQTAVHWTWRCTAASACLQTVPRVIRGSPFTFYIQVSPRDIIKEIFIMPKIPNRKFSFKRVQANPPRLTLVVFHSQPRPSRNFASGYLCQTPHPPLVVNPNWVLLNLPTAPTSYITNIRCWNFQSVLWQNLLLAPNGVMGCLGMAKLFTPVAVQLPCSADTIATQL